MAILDFPEPSTPATIRLHENITIMDTAKMVVGESAVRIRREFELNSDPDTSEGEKAAIRWVAFIESVKTDSSYLNIESIADVQSIIERVRHVGFIDQVELMLMDYMLRMGPSSREVVRVSLSQILGTLNTISLRDSKQTKLSDADYNRLLHDDEWLVPLLLLRTVGF